MSIYVVRHGQTDWNKAGTVQGRYDTELNDAGKAQAKEAKEAVRDVVFTRCLCSPLTRARQTAEIILEGRDTPITFDDRLVEMAYGIYEGTNWRAGHYQELRRMLANRYPGGESYLDVAHRAFSFLDEIMPLAEEGDILIVSHGGIGRVIHSYFVDDVDNDAFVDNLCPNGGVRKYEPVKRFIPPVVPLPKP
ncbi:MAG: histidine phosphatase family protein [Bacilli bacterium]|nr:histidine phosphatase family protein [Bacilli bacterium]